METITTFQAMILGFVQGITEFLPISSSGHLVIFQEFFGMNDVEKNHVLFATLLHFGTLLSVLMVYSKDILNLIKEFFNIIGDIARGRFTMGDSPHRKMIVLLIVATIPTVIVALLFKGALERMFSSIRIVGFTLIITGLLLRLSSKLIPGSKDELSTKYSNAFIIGLFQSVAIIPGISRSGSTIVGGLFNGLGKEFVVKFSFLMSIPAIIGAGVLHIPDIVQTGFNNELIFPYIIGTVIAAITGFLAIKFLINVLMKGKLYLFSYYCWAVAAIIIIKTLL
jgi:undecaprenyl-diphosphatase